MYAYYFNLFEANMVYYLLNTVRGNEAIFNHKKIMRSLMKSHLNICPVTND